MLRQTRHLAAVFGLFAGLTACGTTTPVETPDGFEWAGTYAVAEKFGGVSGTWNSNRTLTISETGEVSLRGTEIINPAVSDTEVSWSQADGNGTSARVTLLTESSDSYFWSSPVSGRLFQGSIQYPGQGGLDFRGIIE